MDSLVIQAIQLSYQLIRNQQVGGSNPLLGSSFYLFILRLSKGYIFEGLFLCFRKIGGNRDQDVDVYIGGGEAAPSI